ncbi:MAG: hypothetical protein CMF41_02800 [Legionellales bacterium]|nr:hypothetical protein [Legionellales bacterium]OUX65435.1 MAG: hypothetical protein CBE41_01595 [Gammaproteobacteria bacterium TMED281]
MSDCQCCNRTKPNPENSFKENLNLVILLIGLLMLIPSVDMVIDSLVGPIPFFVFSTLLIGLSGHFEFKKHWHYGVLACLSILWIIFSPSLLANFIVNPYLVTATVSLFGAAMLFAVIDHRIIQEKESISRMTFIICCITWTLSFASFFHPNLPMMIDDVFLTLGIFTNRGQISSFVLKLLGNEMNTPSCNHVDDKWGPIYLKSLLVTSMALGLIHGIFHLSLITGVSAFILNYMVACPCIFILAKQHFQKYVENELLKKNFVVSNNICVSVEMSTSYVNSDVFGKFQIYNQYEPEVNDIISIEEDNYHNVIVIAVLLDVMILIFINYCLFSGILITPGAVCAMSHAGCLLSYMMSIQMTDTSTPILSAN